MDAKTLNVYYPFCCINNKFIHITTRNVRLPSFRESFYFLRLYEMGKCRTEETRQNSMVYYFTRTRTQYNI